MTGSKPFSHGAGVQVPTIDEVPPERVMMDRELRWMLERDGYDLHEIAERLTALDYGYEMPGSDVKIALEEVVDNVFELVKQGLNPPVMSSAALIGAACYNGDSLFLWQLLPQTICSGVAGRRLGDVVSTGIPQLDDRPILEATTCSQHYWPAGATLFRFAPDLVELGPRPT